MPAYDRTTRNGAVIVDLGLFEGTAEDASQAAKEYVMREMNLRAAAVADDVPEAKADVEFKDIEFDKTENLLTVPFHLVY